ncbi:MAG: hypothetical protein AAB447_01030 [Patescibacteria group bacterium]
MAEASFLEAEEKEVSSEELIACAQDFDALERVLEGITAFSDGSKTYSFADIISQVNEARETGNFSRVTKILGLRNKVQALLEAGLV